MKTRIITNGRVYRVEREARFLFWKVWNLIGEVNTLEEAHSLLQFWRDYMHDRSSGWKVVE